MEAYDTSYRLSSLLCLPTGTLYCKDVSIMSSPNRKVLGHSWKLECQQRRNEEESEVDRVHHVHQSLRHVGFEALQRQGSSVDQARQPWPLLALFSVRSTARSMMKRDLTQKQCKQALVCWFEDREISGTPCMTKPIVIVGSRSPQP